MDSRELGWKYVTVSEILSHVPCELLFAYLVVSAASTDSALYDGENTLGEKICDLKSATVTGRPFSPKEPVYCRRGLYVYVGTNVSGIFVLWRPLGQKKE